jgi:phosphoadenosine phosphosulfate reductase
MNEQIKRAAHGDAGALAELNRVLEPLSAEKRVAWSLQHLPGAHVLTSSFGAQAAVSLHLVTRQASRIPVILLDTGYCSRRPTLLSRLTERLSLNLKVYRSTLSPAWIEARFGKLWEQGAAGLEKYNDLTKLEPMRRALRGPVRTAGSRGCGALRRAVGKTSGLSNGAKGPSESTRSWIGPIATSALISRSTNCPTARCGTAVTYRSAIGIRRVPCTRSLTWKRRASWV